MGDPAGNMRSCRAVDSFLKVKKSTQSLHCLPLWHGAVSRCTNWGPEVLFCHVHARWHECRPVSGSLCVGHPRASGEHMSNSINTSRSNVSAKHSSNQDHFSNRSSFAHEGGWGNTMNTMGGRAKQCLEKQEPLGECSRV